MLVLGVSAAIANVDVRHDAHRLDGPDRLVAAGGRVRGGAGPGHAGVRGGVACAVARGSHRPRTAAARGTPRGAGPRGAGGRADRADAELQRRVRAILDESERRQERELALRVAEVVKDVNAQRQADLVKIDRSLGFIQSSTYGEQMKQRELVNYLLKVSQKQ